MSILALIAEFENDIRRERQMHGVKHALERGGEVRTQALLTEDLVAQVRDMLAQEHHVRFGPNVISDFRISGGPMMHTDEVGES